MLSAFDTNAQIATQMMRPSFFVRSLSDFPVIDPLRCILC
jgi:hypothetical protein